MTPAATSSTTPASANDAAASAAAAAAYTKACQDVSGPKANPRAKQILDSLMAHLHAFAREVELTNDEWLLACDTLVKSGHISDSKRNEMILISDVLGLESLIDAMAHEKAAKATSSSSSSDAKAKSTDSAILGPFYRDDAPHYENGADIVLDHSLVSHEGKKGQTTLLWGTVRDTQGNVVKGAEIDVWHTAPNGFYEQQDEAQPEHNNRGRFKTADDGSYSLRCLRPTAYPIPYDSGAGDILKALDRSPMRPAHIHFLIRAPGYKTLVTQIFDDGCPYVGKDAVFADKGSLMVSFAPAGEKGKEAGTALELKYDLTLVRDEQ